MKLFSLITVCVLILIATIHAQQVQKSLVNCGLFSHSCTVFMPEVTECKTTLSGRVLVADDKTPIIGASILVKGTNQGTITDRNGAFILETTEFPPFTIVISYTGFNSQSKLITNHINQDEMIILLKEGILLGEEVILSSGRKRENIAEAPASAGVTNARSKTRKLSEYQSRQQFNGQVNHSANTEQYSLFLENRFLSPLVSPLSTFSADVDRASYSNIRRFINNAQIPPADAVRIEEMINYFDYNYVEPTGKDPLAIHQTLTECPWNPNHQILHIGLQAKTIPSEKLPQSNFVFLIDVSGSMRSQNKLPLVKSSLQNLVKNLRDEDKVAIVTYAGNSGVLLESTAASNKDKIISAINSLSSGGSTAGAEGIRTAYKIAKQNFLSDGNNRIILATDGDFNVGISSPKKLEQLIEGKRKTGIFLSVLAYGMGNYKDEQMQILADKGNGNHAYIDNLQEANKVLVHEFGGTLFTLAKDVKLQIEFNPAYVSHYRLIGYENRLLNPEDFNDDKKDAGEIGSGYTVTALYEIIPAGSKSSFAASIDDLKYQKNEQKNLGNKNNELATVKFRYKKPDGKKSKKIVNTVSPQESNFDSTNEDIQFSIAVAEFGMLLRNSDFIENGNYNQVIDIARKSRTIDKQGYRAEFIRLVEAMQGLDPVLVNE